MSADGKDGEDAPGTLEPFEFGDAGPVSSARPALTALLRQQSCEALTKALALPEMLTPEVFSGRLGLTAAELAVWRRQGRVLALAVAKHGVRYPEWQVTADGRIVDGIADVLAVFRGQHTAAWDFLTGPLQMLNYRTPWRCLRRGQRSLVIGLAHSVSRGDFF